MFLRDIGFEGETEQNVLTVMGSISPDLLVGYSIDHPEVAVVTVETLNSSEITQAALSGDSSIDAFVLSAPGSFAAMKEKGYIASLNQDVDLVEDAKTYYPAVQDVLFDGEQLMGVPLTFSRNAGRSTRRSGMRLDWANSPKRITNCLHSLTPGFWSMRIPIRNIRCAMCSRVGCPVLFFSWSRPILNSLKLQENPFPLTRLHSGRH